MYIKIKIHTFIHSFVHSVVCLTTFPYPLQIRVFHRRWNTCFSFNFPYPHFSLVSSSSCLRLLPYLPVNSIPPFIFPSITVVEGSLHARCNQSIFPSFFLFDVRCSFPPWLYVMLHFHTICPNDLHPSPASHLKNFQVLLIYFPQFPSFTTIQSYTPNVTLYTLCLKIKSNLLEKRVFVL